jgi:hypothetical protein
MNTSEMDYLFDVGEDTYFVIHNEKGVDILDYQGEKLFSLNYATGSNGTLPAQVAQASVTGYIAGLKEGSAQATTTTTEALAPTGNQPTNTGETNR